MKKRVLISIGIIIAVFALGTAAGAFIISAEGLSVSTGVCLFSDNGSCFVIKDQSPIKLTPRNGNIEMFSNLTDGDKIFTLHSGINETYPATTEAFFCLKVHDGEKEAIPEEVITSLTELGWLGTDTKNAETPDITFTKKIDIRKDNGSISLSLPEDWDYKEITELPQDKYFCVDLYKKTSPENKISIEFTDFFAVCGTGLVTQDINLAGYKAHKGIYDNNPSWNYIVFEDTPGYYVIHNLTDDTWWSNYGNEAMEILESIKIADGIVFKEEALNTAKSLSEGEYISHPDEFNPENGTWTFTFRHEETEEIIKINSKGKTIS